MAPEQNSLDEAILSLLAGKPQGLLVAEILEQLELQKQPSLRSLQIRLNKMAEESIIIRIRRSTNTPGKPPFAYFHPDELPKQGSLLDQLLGVKTELQTKSALTEQDLDEEQKRVNAGSYSVMRRIAHEHVVQDAYAWAIVRVAQTLATENPIELILEMAQWVVDDINNLATDIQRLAASGDLRNSEERAGELEMRLGWARQNLQRMWRLDDSFGNESGILSLPSRAKDCRLGDRAEFDAEKARSRLKERIHGSTVIEKRIVPRDIHKSAAGTDASVADLYLEHHQGSFVAPEPVAVTTAAAALVNKELPEYTFQDFDIYPDRLREYTDSQAAIRGLLMSPALRNQLPEEDFKHSRMAAMDLRQYYEDFRVVNRDAEWRPIGSLPLVGVNSKPTLVIRDGRIFPLVHRIDDYEASGLYGQIVRGEIDQFSKVVHQTLSGPMSNIVYAAAVKNPEMSFLAPLVFWFIHRQGMSTKDERLIVGRDDIYRIPFGDTAVAHLLFLGLAKSEVSSGSENTGDDSTGYMYVTFRTARRFSDIGIKNGPAFLDGENRWVREDDINDWQTFIDERYRERSRKRQDVLEPSEYMPFVYLLQQVGVSMFYATPIEALEAIKHSDEGSHFLLPRLEVAFNLQDKKQEEHKLDGMLSWLASGHWELDYHHSQSQFTMGDREPGLPVLVPDVTLIAHEVVTFARDVLGQEVQDELRALIVEIRKFLNL